VDVKEGLLLGEIILKKVIIQSQSASTYTAYEKPFTAVIIIAEPRALRNKCQEWPTVNDQPTNHERYAVILFENIKIIIFII